MKKQYEKIIEKHLFIAEKLIDVWGADTDMSESSINGAKSDLDDLFLIAVPNNVWDEYREKHGIEDMPISPYYNNESLKGK